MLPSFAIPTKPFFISQNWNNYNPMYEQAGFKFKNHNGVDFTNWRDYKTYAVYCPADGFTVYDVGNYPTGGGKQISLISDTVFKENGLEFKMIIIFCHAEHIFSKVGDKPVEGELLMMADNTGFSTGTHTHWGAYRVHPITQAKLDTNDAGNTVDPLKYMRTDYAQDGISYTLLMKNVGRYFTYKFKKPLS